MVIPNYFVEFVEQTVSPFKTKDSVSLLCVLKDMFNAIALLPFITKILAVVHWLILASLVIVKVCNSVVLLLSIKTAV